jgi:hypothetical protein
VMTDTKPVTQPKPEVPVKPNVPSRPRTALPTQTFKPAADAMVAKVKGVMTGMSDSGSAIEAMIEGDPELNTLQVSAPAELLFRAYLNPTSGWRTWFAEAGAEFDDARMGDPNYAIPAMMDFVDRVKNNKVYTEKRPVVDEASAQWRYLALHLGSLFLKLNPMVVAKYNADFDGDAMKVSSDAEAIAGVKSPMDFLIDTAGVGKIDVGYWGEAVWGNSVEENTEILRLLFSSASIPIAISDRGITGMAKALYTSSHGDPDVKGSEPDPTGGHRSLMLWCRAEGVRRYHDRPDHHAALRKQQDDPSDGSGYEWSRPVELGEPSAGEQRAHAAIHHNARSVPPPVHRCDPGSERSRRGSGSRPVQWCHRGQEPSIP